MKKIFILLLGLIIFTSCGKMEVVEMGNFDFGYSQDLNEVAIHSDLIIKGKVIEQKVKEIDTAIYNSLPEERKNPDLPEEIYEGSTEPCIDVFTVNKVKIISSVAGRYKKNDTIEVKQLGGIFKNKKYVANDIRYLEKGKTYMLFLKDYEDMIKGMPASLINPYQGFLELDKNKVKIDNESNYSRINIDKENIIENNTSENVLKDEIKKAVKNKENKHK